MAAPRPSGGMPAAVRPSTSPTRRTWPAVNRSSASGTMIPSATSRRSSSGRMPARWAASANSYRSTVAHYTGERPLRAERVAHPVRPVAVDRVARELTRLIPPPTRCRGARPASDLRARVLRERDTLRNRDPHSRSACGPSVTKSGICPWRSSPAQGREAHRRREHRLPSARRRTPRPHLRQGINGGPRGGARGISTPPASSPAPARDPLGGTCPTRPIGRRKEKSPAGAGHFESRGAEFDPAHWNSRALPHGYLPGRLGGSQRPARMGSYRVVRADAGAVRPSASRLELRVLSRSACSRSHRGTHRSVVGSFHSSPHRTRCEGW
jgi:hypothetical protein